MPEIPLRISTGTVGEYQWLTSDIGLDELLSACPDVVTGKYVAISATDSGSFHPNDQQRAAGWILDSGIAYSPAILEVDELPIEGYDEWYVFTEPTKIGALMRADEVNVFETGIHAGRVHAFANFGIGFAHSDFEGLSTLFWNQLSIIHPELYLSQNLSLNLATRNPSVFAAISAAIRTSESR